MDIREADRGDGVNGTSSLQAAIHAPPAQRAEGQLDGAGGRPLIGMPAFGRCAQRLLTDIQVVALPKLRFAPKFRHRLQRPCCLLSRGLGRVVDPADLPLQVVTVPPPKNTLDNSVGQAFARAEIEGWSGGRNVGKVLALILHIGEAGQGTRGRCGRGGARNHRLRWLADIGRVEDKIRRNIGEAIDITHVCVATGNRSRRKSCGRAWWTPTDASKRPQNASSAVSIHKQTCDIPDLRSFFNVITTWFQKYRSERAMKHHPKNGRRRELIV